MEKKQEETKKGKAGNKNRGADSMKNKQGVAAAVGRGIREAAGFTLFTGVCAGTGVLIGAAKHFYKSSMVPKKHDPRLDSEPSEKEYVAGRKWMNEHPMREDVYIRADDGLQLHGNFIPAEPDRTLTAENQPDRSENAGGRPDQVQNPADPDRAAGPEALQAEHRYAICVHGYGEASESMGLYARVYRDRYGMNVLLPDLRGHGRSDGNYVGMGYDDSRDLLRWIDWVLERDHGAQIVLHGISMGAATVLMTTGYSLPEQVAVAVSDSSYTSAMDIFTAVYRRMDGAVIPAPVMLEAVRGIALVRAGYDIAKASPLEAVSRSKTPTLFIHGQADGFVPPEMMPELYKAASCPKAFQWIPEADHVQSVNVDPETYWAKVERFLRANEVSIG